MSHNIATSTIMENIEKISLDLIDEIRLFHSLLSNSQQMYNTELNQVYLKINGIKNSIEDSEFKLEEYIYRVGEGILYRELYISIMKNLERIAQNIDAACYRFITLNSNKNLEIKKSLIDELKNINEKVILALDKLNESLRSININAEFSNKKCIEITKLEDEIDTLYRDFEFKLFSAKDSSLLTIMLLKDIVDKLEDSADLLKEIANNILHIILVR